MQLDGSKPKHKWQFTINLKVKKTFSRLGQNIVQWKQNGKQNHEIANELKCSKSTVSYYLNETTRIKALLKNNNYPRWKKHHMQKITNFRRTKPITEKLPIMSHRQIQQSITGKASRFQRR